MNILKKNERKKFRNIDLISMQYNLFTLVNQKKYELIFDFGEEKNKEIMIMPNSFITFNDEYENKIAKILEVEQNDIIFIDIHEGSIGVHLRIRNNNKKDNEIINRLKRIDYIKKSKYKTIIRRTSSKSRNFRSKRR